MFPNQAKVFLCTIYSLLCLAGLNYGASPSLLKRIWLKERKTLIA